MLGSHATIDLPQSTEYAKEMRKWEAVHTKWGAPGRPYAFHEFPKAMYRFKQEPGKGIVKDELHIVNNDEEQRNMESRGFHASQEAAMAAVEREHIEHGKLAAEREYEVRHGRLSEGAVREVRAAEEVHGARHLPEVPSTPIKKRGRPVKLKPEGAI
jgi:hypothetical protein